MSSKHSSTSEISGEISEARSSSLCCLAKLFFRALNWSRTDFCETLNKILSYLWSFKLSGIFSKTRPRPGLPLYCEYGSNNKISFNKIWSWSLVQRITTAGLRYQAKKRQLNVTLKKNSYLARSDTKQSFLGSRFLKKQKTHSWQTPFFFRILELTSKIIWQNKYYRKQSILFYFTLTSH